MHARNYLVLTCCAVLLTAMVGCAGDTAMPGSAVLVASGHGQLPYIANDNGTVYLLDEGEKKPVFSAHVARGDSVMVDASENLIVISGKPAEHKPPLSAEHQYKLFFDRDS